MKPVLYIISLHCYFHTYFKWSIYKRRVFCHLPKNKQTQIRKNNWIFFFFFLLLVYRTWTRTFRMGTRTATNSLVKRTAFSSAINIFPNEVPSTVTPDIAAENDSPKNAQIRPYTDVPGPKGLPLIGNSWRFAPLIGKTFFFLSLNIIYHFNKLSRDFLVAFIYHPTY